MLDPVRMCSCMYLFKIGAICQEALSVTIGQLVLLHQQRMWAACDKQLVF